jgi:hypothetical protein
MTRRQGWTDDSLKNLKSTMDEHLLANFDDYGLRHRIRDAIQGEVSSAPSDTSPLQDRSRSSKTIFKKQRAMSHRRPMGPLAAAIAAVCIVAVVGVFVADGGRFPQLSTKPSGPEITTQAPGLFTTGFAPIPSSDAAQFRHITSISLSLGNDWGPHIPNDVDGVSLSLTASQQNDIYQIMKASQRKNASNPVLQSTSLPFDIFMTESARKDIMSYQGYYSTSGAMTLGNQVYAPNSALAQFVNQYMLPQLLQKYREAGKTLPASLSEAALGFVHNLRQPSAAYKYCAPDMVFRRQTTIQQLQSEAISHDFADFQIASITYGLRNADATVVLRHPNRFWARPITLNLVHIQNAWIVIQAGTGKPGNAYDGVTVQSGFGQYQTLIIGPNIGKVLPDGKIPVQEQGKYTFITYDNLSSPAYQRAQIIIYERTPLTKNATPVQAAHALAADPAFQKAAAEALARHAVLVVAGGGDNLLSRDTVVQALGGITSMTGYDSRPSSTVSVWFEGSKRAVFGGSSYTQNGKNQTYMNPSVIDDAIMQATLTLDTWGAVF